MVPFMVMVPFRVYGAFLCVWCPLGCIVPFRVMVPFRVYRAL